MERLTFNNSKNLTLVGNLYPSEGDSIIIMCHGFLSNRYSRGRFERLIKVLNRSGINAFTFDFSGCGESEDENLKVENEVDDLKSAITFMKSKGYKKIALYGHSLGTLVCLRCFTSQIVTMALSGALTDSMHYNWNEISIEGQMEELNEKGHITEIVDDGLREKIIIDKQILMDFGSINQKELLKDITCPVLIIHGDNDEEERLLCDRSKRAMKLLSNNSKLEVIDGASHSFLEMYEILIDLVNSWFTKYLI